MFEDNHGYVAQAGALCGVCFSCPGICLYSTLGKAYSHTSTHILAAVLRCKRLNPTSTFNLQHLYQRLKTTSPLRLEYHMDNCFRGCTRTSYATCSRLFDRRRIVCSHQSQLYGPCVRGTRVCCRLYEHWKMVSDGGTRALNTNVTATSSSIWLYLNCVTIETTTLYTRHLLGIVTT